MRKNRQISAHGYMTLSKNEALINYRLVDKTAYRRNQKFIRSILSFTIYDFLYFPILCVLSWQKWLIIVFIVTEITQNMYFCGRNTLEYTVIKIFKKNLQNTRNPFDNYNSVS